MCVDYYHSPRSEQAYLVLLMKVFIFSIKILTNWVEYIIISHCYYSRTTLCELLLCNEIERMHMNITGGFHTGCVSTSHAH